MAKLVSCLNRGGTSTLAMSAVGIGFSVGSWSATRDGSYFGNPLLVPAIPVVMVVAALVLAAMFKTSPFKGERAAGVQGDPGGERAAGAENSSGEKGGVENGVGPHAQSLFVAAAALVLVALLAIPLVSFLSESEKFVLGVLMTVVEGTASALLTFLFLIPLVRFSPRQIAVTVASGYLLVHLYDGLFLGMPREVCLVQRPLALLVMVALAGVLCRRMGGGAAGERTSGVGWEPSGANSWTGVSPGAGAPFTMPAARPRAVTECLLLGGLVAALLLVQGVYSQVTGLGSVGNVQAFNLFTELFAAGVRAAVLVYCLLRTQDVPPSHVAVCAAIIFLVGIPVVDLSWGTGAYLAGSHIINSARYVLLPLATIVGVQTARRYPDRAAPLILVMMAAANSCYVSRLVAGVALESVADVDAIVPTVSLCSMWVVACVVPLYLLGRERLLGGGRTAAAAAVAGEELTNPAMRREIRFYQRLDALCDKAQLTEREKEILREVLHGYSIESIAARLNLSASTVKTYLSRAYTRFGVSSRQGVLGLLDEGGGPAGGAVAIGGP